MIKPNRFATSILIAALAITSQAAQQKQAPKRDFTKGNTLYVVPYSHLDTQWRWTYPQVIREYIPNTMLDNFKLIEKYPNYVFNFSGSRRYEMMREYYPADYAKVKQYIKQGRWFPCGSSVDESDANVPSGEALIRHVLYGNHFFRKEFGVASQEFMLPDCFGFPYALPTILGHCGLDGFSTQKLTWGSSVGIPFKVGRWEGPDGHQIVAALDPGAYVGEVREDLSQNTSWLARIQNTGKLSGAYVDYHYYGTGDRGGAPDDESVQWAEKSIAGKGPITVLSARADAMFTSFLPSQISKLPRYKGELLLTEHSAGSITSQAYMKRWNRKSELLADAAERASVAATWMGGLTYPSERLYNAWVLTLGTQMHDMLPGTSVPKAYEYCWNDYLLAQNQFAAMTEDAVGAVASTLDTNTKGQPVVVYNPLSVDREDVVSVPVPDAVEVFGPDGKKVSSQISHSPGITVSSRSYQPQSGTMSFVAKVPANGFAVYELREKRANWPKPTASITNRSLESNRFLVKLNEAGDIASIFDKMLNQEMLKSPIRLALQHHNPAAFPAWNMDWADAQKPPYGYVEGRAQIGIKEDGPVKVTLSVTRKTAGSIFTQEISLRDGGETVEVKNIVDWQTKETALKAVFPLTSGNPKATYDLQVGAIERGNDEPKKFEVPMHQWMDLTKPDGSYGVSILNDSKFGGNKPDNDTLQLTMIYTPGVRGGYANQATQDIGRHEITYAIAPHRGDWKDGGTAWQAKRLNQPLHAFLTSRHNGANGKTFSLARTSSNQVEIQAIKKAEDSDEVVIRLRELSGKDAKGVAVRMAGEILSARELDGQERPLGKAKVSNGALNTDVPGFGYKTFALKLAAAPNKAVKTQSAPVALEFDLDAASTDANRADGSINAAGQTLAAEQIPATVSADGVTFKMGSTKDGAKNALSANGQTINLPKGYSRVYVLAAAVGGDASVRFGKEEVTVQDWSGYVGQWDNRLWLGDIGPNHTNYGEWAGLVPGYVKPSEVAWWSSHRHHPTKGNEFYEYSYLYKYGFDLPAGQTTLTLPKDPRVKIFAVSVAKNANDDVVAAAPLSDRLTDRNDSGTPTVEPAEGTFNDVTEVKVTPPLYWRRGALRYTLDGTEPAANSAVYTGPLLINKPVTLNVGAVDSEGRVSHIATAKLDINDTTAPKIVKAVSPKALGVVSLKFSEEIAKSSAESPAVYQLSSGVRVKTATLQSDKRTVELLLESPLPAGKTETVTVNGVSDVAPSANQVRGVTTTVEEGGAVFSSGPLEPNKATVLRADNLPVNGKDAWTINLYVKLDKQPLDRTILAGFGRASDGRTGAGRYIAKFPSGIHFWSANMDVSSTVPFDLGKWQMITATYDGSTLRLFKNGVQIGSREIELVNDDARVRVLPVDAWERQRSMEAAIRDFTIWNQALPPAAVKILWENGQR